VNDSRITIRLAQRADAPGIAALSRVAIEHGLPWRWTPERVRRSISDSATNVIVAHLGEEPVGFAAMKYGEDTAHLLLMAVRRDARRQGVGRAMVRWLEAGWALCSTRWPRATTPRVWTRWCWSGGWAERRGCGPRYRGEPLVRPLTLVAGAAYKAAAVGCKRPDAVSPQQR
jgi:GNAT superfamily N-acetyltransferase